MDSLDDNIYKKIQDIFGKIPDQFRILEQEIDMDLQIEYFEFSKNHKSDLTKNEVLSKIDELFDKDVSINDKKILLSLLASVDEVEAFRAIEKYLKKPQRALKNWALLALQEGRMSLESNLLEENQVFISTGLGGKGKKLRYFVVLFYVKNFLIGDTQYKVIENEFDYIFKKHNSKIEKVEHGNTYSTLKVLIPLDVQVNSIMKNAIDECNQFGGFLKDIYIITNVKALPEKEIKDYMVKKKI